MFVQIISDKAKEWVKNKLIMEDWQINGDIIAIDHHCIENILEGMYDAKIYAQKDYLVL